MHDGGGDHDGAASPKGWAEKEQQKNVVVEGGQVMKQVLSGSSFMRFISILYSTELE
jgi:hypothetical protein